jgi:hypothetical protein
LYELGTSIVVGSSSCSTPLILTHTPRIPLLSPTRLTMVLAKSKKSAGLGNSLMNDRFGKGKGADRRRTSAVVRTNHVTGEQVRCRLFCCLPNPL